GTAGDSEVIRQVGKPQPVSRFLPRNHDLRVLVDRFSLLGVEAANPYPGCPSGSHFLIRPLPPTRVVLEELLRLLNSCFFTCAASGWPDSRREPCDAGLRLCTDAVPVEYCDELPVPPSEVGRIPIQVPDHRLLVGNLEQKRPHCRGGGV